MNREVRAKWLEALRSGEYTQGRKFLKQEDNKEIIRHCCLGVLCELAAVEGVTVEVVGEVNGYKDICFESGDDKRSGYPPDAVLNWAGLHHTDAESLAHLNDYGGNDFTAIADHIEKAY